MNLKVLVLSLLISTSLHAQVDYSDIELKYGDYSMGYRYMDIHENMNKVQLQSLKYFIFI